MPQATSHCPICEAPLSAEAYYISVAANEADRLVAKHLTEAHGRVFNKIILGENDPPKDAGLADID